jgi:hypothetical protein
MYPLLSQFLTTLAAPIEPTTNRRQNMTDHWDWDIKDRVRDKNRPNKPTTYRTINVMSYLMYGRSYAQYFDRSLKTDILPHFSTRLKYRDYECKRFFDRGLTTHPKNLDALITRLAAAMPDTLRMRDVYTATRSTERREEDGLFPIEGHADAEAFWNGFAAFMLTDRKRVNGRVFDHICTPFLHQVTRVTDDDIDEFLCGEHDANIPVLERWFGLGRFTLWDLYRYSKRQLGIELLESMFDAARAVEPRLSRGDFFTDYVRGNVCDHIKNTLGKGQLLGILLQHNAWSYLQAKGLLANDAGVMGLNDPKPNDYCCDGTSCKPRDGFFCSTADNGTECSAQSDECT